MSGEGDETKDLQVANILLQESKYVNYGFDFKDKNGNGDTIPVETFLNFQNKLQTAIQTSKPITAKQMSELATSIITNDSTNQFSSFTLPIQITITYETNENDGKITTTTNSYLEIIKDMFLNFIATTLMDPIYKQVFEVILPTDDDVKANILQTVKSPGFNKWFHEKIMGADTNDISKSKKDYLNELIKQIGFIEKI